MAKFTFTMKNRLEQPVTVETEDMSEVYAMIRQFGAAGWTCGEVPAGGYTLPYEAAENFDWAMIGARHFTFVKDNEEIHAVEHRGTIFTRRHMPATTGAKKMPAKYKYSRGAKPSDPPHMVEKGQGDIDYVPLISFVGNGRTPDALKKQPRVQAA